MARVLVVGCGCRGRALAEALVANGHAVRGTTRSEATLRSIESIGAEAVVADPGRLATLTPQLEAVGVLCWLMGTAKGSSDEVSALHGPRLRSMLDAIVDTPVRGVVYEAAGPHPVSVLERGAAIAERAERTHRIPVGVIGADPRHHDRWLTEGIAAVERVLGR